MAAPFRWSSANKARRKAPGGQPALIAEHPVRVGLKPAPVVAFVALCRTRRVVVAVVRYPVEDGMRVVNYVYIAIDRR
jgi:hypothetical protein